MRNSDYSNREYYANTSRNDFSGSKSYTEKRNMASSSKRSEAKSKFQIRVQKACPTNSAQAFKKQISLLKKQLERLQKQSFKKDNRIFLMQSSFNIGRQMQSQLQQTYRIIYMYEGRIQELEKQLKRLERKISDNIDRIITPQDIEALLNQYRNDNTEMKGTIQGQNRVISELQHKLKTIQSKYFSTSWKLSSQNRMVSNPLKKKFPKLREAIVIQEISLADRENMMGQLDERYQVISKQRQNPKSALKSAPFSKQKGLLSFSNFKQSPDLQTPNSMKYQTSYVTRSDKQPVKQLQANKTSKLFTFNNISQTGSHYGAENIQASPKVYRISQEQYRDSKRREQSDNYQFYRMNQTKKSNQVSQSQPIMMSYSGSETFLNVHNGWLSQNRVLANSRASQNNHGISNSRIVGERMIYDGNQRVISQSPSSHQKVLLNSNNLNDLAKNNSYFAQNRQNGPTYTTSQISPQFYGSKGGQTRQYDKISIKQSDSGKNSKYIMTLSTQKNPQFY